MSHLHHGRRVLVIEDEPDLRALMELVLEDRGYTVLTACDGREGLELLGSNRPDVILLDMKMPVMDGWEFARRYRATFEDRAPIVVVTAAEDLRARADEIGATKALGKPVELDTLFATIEDATSGAARATKVGAPR